MKTLTTMLVAISCITAAAQAPVNGDTPQVQAIPPLVSAEIATLPPPAPKPRKRPSRAPTMEDVSALRVKLRTMENQLNVTSAVESGTERSTHARFVRSEVIFQYQPTSIFEVETSTERMTTIRLQPGERITTQNGLPKAADTVQWIVDTVESGEGANKVVSVMIKPIASGIETNLLIPTNRRTYYFTLYSRSQAYMPIVGFSYPFDEAEAKHIAEVKNAEEESKHEAVALAPEQLRFGYEIKGASVEWRPVRVFDDGTKTYIQMPQAMKSGEAPALFVIDEQGTAMLVNYRVKGDYYIVDRIFMKAQLRVGTKTAVDILRG